MVKHLEFRWKYTDKTIVKNGVKMDFSNNHILSIREKSKQSMALALDSFDSASILSRYSKFIHSYLFLKDSLTSLIDCFFTAHEIKIKENLTENLAVFKELNQRISWYAKKLEEVPKYILEIDENSLGDKQTIRDYEKLLNRYSTLIHQFQRAFNHFVKNDLLTSSERHKRETRKKKIRSSLIKIAPPVSIAVLLIVLGVLYLFYLNFSPSRHFLAQGQFFWKSADFTNFSESHSKIFEVKGGGKFREYTISLPRTVKMEIFRFDPINLRVKEIDVDNIQLIDGKGDILREFEFNVGDPLWKTINCKVLNLPTGILKLRPKNHDPYIISPKFPKYEVSQIKIRLRLFDRSGFPDWLLTIY